MPSVPLISVVIPSYNSARLLPETLESILAQDVRELEMIIVDDGSTDDTANIIRPYLNSRVRYLHLENSGGPSRPRNVGIRHARGRFIALFDSDDVMLPGKLQNSLHAFERAPSSGFLCTDFSCMDEHGEVFLESWLSKYERFQRLPKQSIGDHAYLIRQPIAYDYLVRHNFVGTSSVLIRRDIFDDVGYFDETLKNGDDGDMWFRILSRYDVVYLDKPYHHYRVREGSVLRRDPLKSVPYRIAVLKKQFTRPMSRMHRFILRRRLAEYYTTMGERCRDEQRRSVARSHYLASLKAFASWFALRGLILTFVPEPLRLSLVNCRDALLGRPRPSPPSDER